MNPCAHDYATLGIDIAEYLHTQGVTQNINQEQVDADQLAVFIGPMPDTPNRAVSIIGPWLDRSDSDNSTTARFMISTRSEPWDIVGHGTDCQNIVSALHRPNTAFNLTAKQAVFHCEQVISDPPVQDQNRRWIRVDTYTTRLQPPTT